MCRLYFVPAVQVDRTRESGGNTEIEPKGPGKRGHIVADTLLPADTNVFPFARERNICCGHRFCDRDIKNVSDFVQKHFVPTTNVSQFGQPKKHHEKQCVRNNVSSFTRALTLKNATTKSDKKFVRNTVSETTSLANLFR